MGMYTELVLSVRIKNLSEDHIKILEWLNKPTEEPPDINLEHELFKCDRWTSIGRSSSYYFEGGPYYSFYWDKIANCHFLQTKFDIKNYDDEIEKFLDWLSPYIDTEFCGYKRYEQAEIPTLIYQEKGKIINVYVGDLDKCDNYGFFTEV